MVSAPYPGLDPDLYTIVTRLNANFPANQHRLAVDEFRARLEALADGKVTTHAPGMAVQDVTLDLIGRAVRIRIYRPAPWTEGGSAMLYMHGGGWVLGSIEGHDQTCTDLAGPNWHRCGQH